MEREIEPAIENTRSNFWRFGKNYSGIGERIQGLALIRGILGRKMIEAVGLSFSFSVFAPHFSFVNAINFLPQNCNCEQNQRMFVYSYSAIGKEQGSTYNCFVEYNHNKLLPYFRLVC